MANGNMRVRWPRCARRVGRLLPEEYRRHRRAARRERLLAWRSVLDAAVARLDEGETGERGSVVGLAPEAFWAHRQAAREEDLRAVRSLVDSFLGWLETWLEEPSPAQTVRRVEIE